MPENVEGPVYKERRVPIGTRIQLEVPARTFLIVNGTVFCYSGYFMYHTLKAMYHVNKETAS